ncbi:MAG: WbqC family protein [Deltaproteobacteria bacterium]|nr:WbqC family protein [Deltaproteobacteria bacterium]
MVVAANPPYFCPYPGLFYKARLADVLVILDEVQFPRRTTWLSRNRFKNDQGALWLTVPVWKKGLGLQLISQVRICYDDRWPRKHLESLKVAYKHAPYLDEHVRFLEEMFSAKYEKLADLNLAIIRYLWSCLKLETNLVLQSELAVQSKGTRLLVDICRAVEASAFLVLEPVQKHLDQELFKENGIDLRPVKYAPPVYPQLWGDFLANLSTFDMLLNVGPKSPEVLWGGKPLTLKAGPAVV